MSISDIVSWYPLILLGGKGKTNHFLCWHSICFVLAVSFWAGLLAIPQCENISKNNARLGTSLLNVSIFQVGTEQVKRK